MPTTGAPHWATACSGGLCASCPLCRQRHKKAGLTYSHLSCINSTFKRSKTILFWLLRRPQSWVRMRRESPWVLRILQGGSNLVSYHHLPWQYRAKKVCCFFSPNYVNTCVRPWPQGSGKSRTKAYCLNGLKACSFWTTGTQDWNNNNNNPWWVHDTHPCSVHAWPLFRSNVINTHKFTWGNYSPESCPSFPCSGFPDLANENKAGKEFPQAPTTSLNLGCRGSHLP